MRRVGLQVIGIFMLVSLLVGIMPIFSTPAYAAVNQSIVPLPQPADDAVCTEDISAAVAWMNKFTLIVLDDVSHPAFQHVHGAAYIGGNFGSTNSHVFGQNVGFACTDNALTILGTVAATSPGGGTLHVQSGHASFKQAVSPRINMNSGCSATQDSTLSDTGITADLTAASAFLANATGNNGSPKVAGNGKLVFEIKTVTANGLAIFNVSAEEVFDTSINNPSSNIDFVYGSGIDPNSTTVLVNVSGTSLNWTNNAHFDNSVQQNAGRILWNIYNATQITLPKQWYGALLAVNANMNAGSQNLTGSIAVKSLTSAGEIHDPAFALSNTTPLTDVCDNPPDFEISGVGKCEELKSKLGSQLGSWPYGDTFNELKIDVLDAPENGNYALWKYVPIAGDKAQGYTPYLGGSTAAGQEYIVSPFGTITVSTTDFAGNVIAYNTSQSGILTNWKSTFGIDFVLVKAGPGADAYVYTPEAFFDTKLQSPKPSISHVTFCWDGTPPITPEPAIAIKKYTNGADADAPDGASVPQVSPAGEIVWTYVVSNTGNIAFDRDDVVVTDNRKDVPTPESVKPQFDQEMLGNGDTTLDPGEIWQYKATGSALDLRHATGDYIVDGCLTAQGLARPTYNNLGTVTISAHQLVASDPSHYCNPELPGIAIKKYTNGADADHPNGADVPKIAPQGAIEWSYVVSNTGNVPFTQDSVVVTDNRQNVPATDSVVPAYDREVAGNGDNIFDPGEIWLYKAAGNALSLLDEAGDHVVAGCLTGQGLNRPTYHNVGTVTISDTGLTASDASHYCNPEQPGIAIKKYTNGADADDPNGDDVPEITPGGEIIWTYRVANTGNVPFAKGSVLVTDNRQNIPVPNSIVPAFDSELSGNGDDILDPGETWQYKATGLALNLVEEAGDHIVNGCQTGQSSYRATYNNVGTVTVSQTNLMDNDPSHYCNPEQPAIAIKKYTNGEDADSPTGPVVPVGSEVTWSYVVTNAGNVVLANVVVTDNIAGVTPVYVSGDTNNDKRLDLTETWRYTATGIAIAGQYANTGYVRGESPAAVVVRADDPSHYFGQLPDVPLSAALGDRVWLDSNANGVQDDGEPGVPDVTVNLLHGDCTTATGQSITTDANGWYGFGNLPAGSYCVHFDLSTLPANHALTQQQVGDVATDSDAEPTTGKTATVTLAAGESNLTLDAGLVVRSLSVTATPQCVQDAPYLQYSVTPVNFTPNANPVTIRFVEVATDALLYEYTNQPLQGTMLWPEAGVDQNGVGNQWPGWSFENGQWVDKGSALRPQVRVEFEVNPSAAVTVEYPPSNPTCSPGPRGSLGNRVWIDENENGAQDDGEPNVPAVKVILYNCLDEQVGTPQVTDEAGEYLFDALVPGCYYVVFDPTTLPDEFGFTTPQQAGVSSALDSDADPVTGRTPSVTLNAGDAYRDLDAGIVADPPPPTNLPGEEQPQARVSLFLPTVQGKQ